MIQIIIVVAEQTRKINIKKLKQVLQFTVNGGSHLKGTLLKSWQGARSLFHMIPLYNPLSAWFIVVIKVLTKLPDENLSQQAENQCSHALSANLWREQSSTAAGNRAMQSGSCMEQTRVCHTWATGKFIQSFPPPLHSTPIHSTPDTCWLFCFCGSFSLVFLHVAWPLQGPSKAINNSTAGEFI